MRGDGTNGVNWEGWVPGTTSDAYCRRSKAKLASVGLRFNDHPPCSRNSLLAEILSSSRLLPLKKSSYNQRPLVETKTLYRSKSAPGRPETGKRLATLGCT